MIKKLGTIALLIYLSNLSFLVLSQPIIIIENDWSSQRVLANILGEILKQQGYQVEYRPSDTFRQFEAMGNDLMHVQVEAWEGTMSQDFALALANGEIEDMGSYSASSREEWWYPEHVENLCPGLPDWRALLRCSAIFSSSPEDAQGRFLAGPWEKHHQDRVDALNLNFKVDFAAHVETLWAELEAAVSQKKPILLFNWTPNSIEIKYAGKFVEFPSYHPDCESNKSWGVNPEMLFDCGSPQSAWIKKAVSSNFKQNWPCAYYIIRHMDFDNKALSSFAAAIDFDGLNRVQVARNWVNTNKAQWQNWLPEKCESSQ